MDGVLELFKEAEGCRVAVVVDDLAAEYLRSHGVSLAADRAMVYSLDGALGERGADLGSFAPEVMIFLITLPLKEAAPLIAHNVRVANCPSVHVLTTTSMEAAAPNEGVEMEEPYRFLLKDLHPAKATCSYFPMHSVRLSEDLAILSSVDARCFFSITLNRLGAWSPVLNSPEGARKVLQYNDDENFSDVLVTVEEAEIGQIPQVLRSQMRCVAHQLAGALVFNLNVDVSTSIFALGKSADAIGHTLQPLLEPLMEQYEEAASLAVRGGADGAFDDRPLMSGRGTTDVKLQALAIDWSREHVAGVGRGGNNGGSGGKLTRASLILVDRLQDLFTPAVVDSDMEESPYGESAETDSLAPTSLSATPPYHAKNSSSTGPAPHWEDQVSVHYKPRFALPDSVLSARERALLQLLAMPGAGLSEAIPFLISFLEEPREVQSIDPCSGPGCVLSTLLLAAMTLHLVGLDTSSEADDNDGGFDPPAGEQLSSLPMLAGALVEYVMWRAPLLELAALKVHGLLGPHSLVLESVQAVRGLSLEDTAASSGLLGEGILRMELQQAMEGAAGSLAELAYRSSVQVGGRAAQEGRTVDDEDSFVFAKSALQQLQQREEAGAGMVTVKSVSTRERQEKTREGSHRQESKASRVKGLLALLCRDLQKQQPDREDGGATVLAALEYVESPLAKLKRAGLGLLSQGFGAFGFGGGSAAAAGPATPSPADNPVVVIFVAGGICQREIAQVRRQLASARDGGGGGGGSPRILLVSNRVLDSPEMAAGLFSGLL